VVFPLLVLALFLAVWHATGHPLLCMHPTERTFPAMTPSCMIVISGNHGLLFACRGAEGILLTRGSRLTSD
jgi:hypothetical protein